MSAANYDKHLRVAMKLARDAGGAVMARYQRSDLSIQSKGAEGPVTEADRAAHRLITTELAEAFPDDVIVSEEGADDPRRQEGKGAWIVDPLDGTADFIEGNGEFSVLIGYVVQGSPVVGVVYQPVGDAIFYAVKNEGAFAEVDGKPAARLRVSDTKDPARMTAVVSRSHRSKTVDKVLKAIAPAREITCGSVGLKVTKLVLGEADLYFHPSKMTKIWDTAGPNIILQEAGGILTDFAGRPLQYEGAGLAHTGGLAASNNTAHAELLCRVKEVAEEAELI
jgi:3'(2'), 5'-bisphosphate nucleotidase